MGRGANRLVSCPRAAMTGLKYRAVRIGSDAGKGQAGSESFFGLHSGGALSSQRQSVGERWPADPCRDGLNPAVPSFRERNARRNCESSKGDSGRTWRAYRLLRTGTWCYSVRCVTRRGPPGVMPSDEPPAPASSTPLLSIACCTLAISF